MGPITSLSSAREFRALELDSLVRTGKLHKFVGTSAFYTTLKRVGGSHWTSDFDFNRDVGQSYSIAFSSEVIGLIVETRRHPLLKGLIHDVYSKLNIPIVLFCGVENFEWVRKWQVDDTFANIPFQIILIKRNKLDGSDYNRLFLTLDFWRLFLRFKKVFIFQTDSLLCDSSAFPFDHFFKYDYIGASWSRRRPVGLTIDGGSGGLSLRSPVLSYRCLQVFPIDQWPGGEDGFFAFHIEYLGGYVSDMLDSAKFAAQEIFFPGCFGCHKPALLADSSLDDFLRYCPEARRII